MKKNILKITLVIAFTIAMIMNFGIKSETSATMAPAPCCTLSLGQNCDCGEIIVLNARLTEEQ